MNHHSLKNAADKLKQTHSEYSARVQRSDNAGGKPSNSGIKSTLGIFLPSQFFSLPAFPKIDLPRTVLAGLLGALISVSLAGCGGHLSPEVQSFVDSVWVVGMTVISTSAAALGTICRDCFIMVFRNRKPVLMCIVLLLIFIFGVNVVFLMNCGDWESSGLLFYCFLPFPSAFAIGLVENGLRRYLVGNLIVCLAIVLVIHRPAFAPLIAALQPIIFVRLYRNYWMWETEE